MLEVVKNQENPHRPPLVALCEYSNYLKRILRAKFADESSPQAQEYLESLQKQKWEKEKIQEALSQFESPEQLVTQMRKLRQEIMCSLIVGDVTGALTFEDVGRTMSDFAMIAVDLTVKTHARELAKRFGVPSSELGVPQDLMVVGMGKLGGHELNVSSDIDLIFFYDEDGQCRPTEAYPNVRKQLSNFEFFERLAKKVIPALADLTADGFVFRVDMRLRPNGDSGPIVASSEMLEEYLMTQGRDWERFAYLKGRIINGPVFCTQEVFEIEKKNIQDIIRPFVYRKYLDFGAISALTELHAKIRAASQKRELTSLKNGQNIKLGRGGIREIEFIVQTFQVIRGGRNSKLRETSTLKALEHLAQEGVISKEHALKLAEDYVFLRNLEHALQYVDDEQTQLLPEDEQKQKKIAQMLGLDHAELVEKLKAVSEFVASRFDAIFQTSSDESSDQWPLGWEAGNPEAQPGLSTLLKGMGYQSPEQSASLILSLMSVRALKVINPAARQRMVRLVKRVAQNMDDVIKHTDGLVDKDALLERYLKFLEVIAGRPTYVSLLLQYPVAAKRVGKLLAASRWATDYLLRHPLLLDEMLDERVTLIDDYTPVDFSDYIERTRERLAEIDEEDLEARMNRIREAHHGRLFRLLLADLEGRFSVERLADQLSALADATLELTIEESWKTVPGRHLEVPKFAVISYGKLGGKELSYASDLDLVFIYDDDSAEAEKIYSRFARRFVNWLTATTSSGYLFDIDTRLRPNGESGMLVCSLDSYKKYERNEDGTGAWLWEHQALTRGRFSAGDREIGQAFEQIRVEILRKQRDPQQTAVEIQQMRQKMHEGHPNKSELFDIKHDTGGMVDVEFIVQYLVLAYSHERPELVHNFGNIKLLSMGAEAGLIDPELADEVIKIYRHYRKLQHEFRLNSPESLPVRYPKEQVQTQAQTVIKLWNQIFSVAQP